jgi:hypothetical protein
MRVCGVRTCPGPMMVSFQFGHEDIVAVLETVGTRSVTDALLTHHFRAPREAEVVRNSGRYLAERVGREGIIFVPIRRKRKRKEKDTSHKYTPLCHRCDRNETCVYDACMRFWCIYYDVGLGPTAG